MISLTGGISKAGQMVDVTGAAWSALEEYGLVDSYLSAVAQGLLEFVQAVRGNVPPKFSAIQAMMSQEMEEACSLSASRGGAPVAFPLENDGPAGQTSLEAIRARHEVDPFDVEAMIKLAFPLNYDSRYSNLAGTCGSQEPRPGLQRER